MAMTKLALKTLAHSGYLSIIQWEAAAMHHIGDAVTARKQGKHVTVIEVLRYMILVV